MAYHTHDYGCPACGGTDYCATEDIDDCDCPSCEAAREELGYCGPEGDGCSDTEDDDE